MNLWQYIRLPTGTVPESIAINMGIVSALGVLIGIVLIKLPKEFIQGLPSLFQAVLPASIEQSQKYYWRLAIVRLTKIL